MGEKNKAGGRNCLQKEKQKGRKKLNSPEDYFDANASYKTSSAGYNTELHFSTNGMIQICLLGLCFYYSCQLCNLERRCSICCSFVILHLFSINCLILLESFVSQDIILNVRLEFGIQVLNASRPSIDVSTYIEKDYNFSTQQVNPCLNKDWKLISETENTLAPLLV